MFIKFFGKACVLAFVLSASLQAAENQNAPCKELVEQTQTLSQVKWPKSASGNAAKKVLGKVVLSAQVRDEFTKFVSERSADWNEGDGRIVQSGIFILEKDAHFKTAYQAALAKKKKTNPDDILR